MAPIQAMHGNNTIGTSLSSHAAYFVNMFLLDFRRIAGVNLVKAELVMKCHGLDIFL